MSEADAAALVSTGAALFATKLFFTSFSVLWVYDYFVTLADEIKYGWSGEKSWTFLLFLGNRYIPVLQISWITTAMFSDLKLFCQNTKWFSVVYAHVANGLSGLAIALRIYAVTERNKLLCAPLVLLLLAQACNGFVSGVRFMMIPMPTVPEAILSRFRICVYPRYRPGALVFGGTALAFDIVAFIILLYKAKRLRMRGYLGASGLLNTIMQDATVYFVLISLVQFLALLFLFVVPGVIQFLPGAAITTFVPIMAARLMLSLKKAAAQPVGPWSLATMTSDYHSRRSPGDRALHFVSNMSDASRGTSETSAKPNEEDIELEFTPRLPRNHGPQQLC